MYFYDQSGTGHDFVKTKSLSEVHKKLTRIFIKNLLTNGKKSNIMQYRKFDIRNPVSKSK